MNLSRRAAAWGPVLAATMTAFNRSGAGLEVPASCNAVALACIYGGAEGSAAPEGRTWAATTTQTPGRNRNGSGRAILINGGLILIGVYMAQPFLTAASLDLLARICVVAFSVAIPLLAALVLVNRRELSRRRATRSRIVVWARVVAQNLAFVGAVAGFWHISWIAGVGMLAGGLMAVAVHAAGYLDLRRDQTPMAQAARAPGDTDS